MAYFDHVTIFLLVNCEIQGEFLLALPIVCNSYVQNVFRGACNAIRGDLQEFADFSKQILGRLPIAFNLSKGLKFIYDIYESEMSCVRERFALYAWGQGACVETPCGVESRSPSKLCDLVGSSPVNRDFSHRK